MESNLINAEIKAAIGIESETSILEIEKEAIRRWAEAIGDANPLYHDEEYARKSGYRSLVAPPFFIPHYHYRLIYGKAKASYKSPLGRNLAGGDEIEIIKPLQAGDILYLTTKLADVVEKESRLGRMLIFVSEMTIRNKEGEILAKSRHIEMTY